MFREFKALGLNAIKDSKKPAETVMINTDHIIMLTPDGEGCKMVFADHGPVRIATSYELTKAMLDGSAERSYKAPDPQKM